MFKFIRRMATVALIIGVLSYYTNDDVKIYAKNLSDMIKNEIVNMTETPGFTPRVNVNVDTEQEKLAQEQVDKGHSPWRLDLVQSAITFVSLKMFPNGIYGTFPISQSEIKIISESNSEAIVEVSGDKTPIRRVYFKRLIRQDKSGIWSVVGYDPKDLLSVLAS